MRMVSRQQMIDWNFKTGKTLQETNKCLSLHSWEILTDEEVEIFLKKKRFRTKEEEKEFIRIWKNKYGVEGRSNWFYEMCKYHKGY